MTAETWISGCLAVAVIAFLALRVRIAAADGPAHWTSRTVLDPILSAAFCGGLLGWASPDWIATPITASLTPGFAFLGGWVGLVAGCGLDLRVIHRESLWTFLYEAAGAAMGAIVVFVVATAVARAVPAAPDIGVPALFLVAAVCLAAPALPALGSGSGRAQGRAAGGGRSGFWVPSSLAALAVLAAAVGTGTGPAHAHHLSLPGVDLPTALAMNSLGGRLLWGLVAGGMAGLLADLATRADSVAGGLYTPLAAVVLLAAGIAASLGVEPLLVGVVGGFWLINATLRRLDLLHVLERGAILPRLVVPFLAAWLVGSSLRSAAVDLRIFLFVGLAVIVLRPLVRVAITRTVQGATPTGRRRRGEPLPANLVAIDELGILIGALLTRVLEPAAGAGALAGVLMGVLVLGGAGRWWAHREALRSAHGPD